MLYLSLIIGTAVGLVLGGDLRGLGRLQLRWWGLFVAAIVSWLVASVVGSQAGALYIAALWSLFGVALANIRIAGVPWVAVGIGLNAVVITANGGSMPVLVAELHAVCHCDAELSSLAHPMSSDTRLMLLADVIPVGLTGRIYSLGDLMLASGSFLVTSTAIAGRPLGRAARTLIMKRSSLTRPAP